MLSFLPLDFSANNTNAIYSAAVRPLFRFPTSRNFTNKSVASGGIWTFLKFSQKSQGRWGRRIWRQDWFCNVCAASPDIEEESFKVNKALKIFFYFFQSTFRIQEKEFRLLSPKVVMLPPCLGRTSAAQISLSKVQAAPRVSIKKQAVRVSFAEVSWRTQALCNRRTRQNFHYSWKKPVCRVIVTGADAGISEYQTLIDTDQS